MNSTLEKLLRAQAVENISDQESPYGAYGACGIVRENKL